MRTRALGLRPIGRAVGNGRVEQLGVVGGGHIERAGLFDLVEGSGERRRHAAQRHDDLGMARGDCSDRLRPARHGFQRRQRLFELRDKRGGGVKLGFGQRQARIGMVQRRLLPGAVLGDFAAQCRQRMGKPRGAVLRPRTA